MIKKGPGHSLYGDSQDKLSGSSSSSDSLPANGIDLTELSRNMLNRLGRTIENDVVPRLMLALGSASRSELTAARLHAASVHGKVEEFVHLVVRHDTPVAIRYVETLRADGYALATLYLDLLAPAARRLGEMWESDECSFVDVTIGVCRLHQVLLEFSRCFDPPQKSVRRDRSALILPAPGEQHTFGIFVVMEFLRRAGWDCFSGTPATAGDFQKLVAAQDYSVIGISVSTVAKLDETEAQIRHIRRHSRNRAAMVLVGGQAIVENPSLADTLGADAMAEDGPRTVSTIEFLIRQQLDNPAN